MKLFRYGYTKDGKDNSVTIAVDNQWQAQLYFLKHFPDAKILYVTEEEMLYGRADVTRDYSKFSYSWDSMTYKGN